MQAFRCMNHPQETAVAQCISCGKPLCPQCHNADTGYCMYQCGEVTFGSSGHVRKKNPIWTILISMLAILGGFAVLLLAICGTMFFSY